MLRKASYALLITAIILNIGAGVWYNGIPEEISRIFDDIEIFSDEDIEINIPVSRSGDILVSGYNFSVELERTTEEGETDSGSLEQSGIVTRTMKVLETRIERTGAQVLTYDNSENEDITFMGDFRSERRLFIDGGLGEMAEERSSRMEISSSAGGKPQVSTLDIKLSEARGYWQDLLWRSILPPGRTLNQSSGGTVDSSLSVQEIGILIPSVKMVWYVSRISTDVEGTSADISVRSEGLRDLEISLEIGFNDRCPYPVRTELVLDGTYGTDDGTVNVLLESSENELDHSIGSGSEIAWSFMRVNTGQENPGQTGKRGMVVEEGGKTAFWSSPQESLDLARQNGGAVADFIAEHSDTDITSVLTSYYRNESLREGARIWNMTLAAWEASGSASCINFEVASQKGTDILGRKRMEILSESEFELDIVPISDRRTITLSRHEEILRANEFADVMFTGTEYVPTYGLDIVSRGEGGQGPLSTLIYNMFGMEREHEEDLFISHVYDRSDPLTIYILVVDGSNGDIISMTEASGFCTLVFSSYGLDLA